jgi:transketolase
MTKPTNEHLKNFKMLEIPKQQLRKAFILTLTELARKDPRVILIIGDVGFSFLEPFIQEFPNQFLNAGIAEQNMMSMAAGMALEGWKPYVYTMSNFILLRPLEQLRNDICYANANVKLFGVKGGASYKFLGMSHNLVKGEEKGMLSFLPNIHSYFPDTEARTEALMEEEYKREGPAYFSI